MSKELDSILASNYGSERSPRSRLPMDVYISHVSPIDHLSYLWRRYISSTIQIPRMSQMVTFDSFNYMPGYVTRVYMCCEESEYLPSHQTQMHSSNYFYIYILIELLMRREFRTHFDEEERDKIIAFRDSMRQKRISPNSA